MMLEIGKVLKYLMLEDIQMRQRVMEELAFLQCQRFLACLRFLEMFGL